MKSDNIYIIDMHSLIYKAYYAIRNLTSSSGMSTNAIFGFFRMLLKIIKDYKPDKIIAVYDVGKKTFRNDIYTDYKANRKPMPEDLKPQITIIQELLDKINIPNLGIKGYEADDIIGTLCKKYKDKYNIFIISGDKDLCQLVDDNVIILNSKRGISDIIKVNKLEIEKKYNIKRNQFIDYLALAGDTSDNIPGVQGIGPKTASNLLNQWSNLDSLYKNIEKVKSKNVRNKLLKNRDNAFLSQKLVTIDTEVPIDINITNVKFSISNLNNAANKFSELEIISLLKDIETLSGNSVFKKTAVPEYKIINTLQSFKNLIKIYENKNLFFWTGWEHDKPIFIILKDIDTNEPYQFIDFLKIEIEHFRLFEPIFANSNIQSYNCKSLIKYLYSLNMVPINKFNDLKILLYLQPNIKQGDLKNILLKKYNVDLPDINDIDYNSRDLFEKDIKQEYIDNSITFIQYLIKLFTDTYNECKKYNLINLYENFELPLIKILAKMEWEGINVNHEYLLSLQELLQNKLSNLTDKIFSITEEKFNLNSPKQLSEILFTKLKLPVIKKTKTHYSTNNEVLNELKHQHEICEFILQYRKYSKILNTYITPLIDLSKSGRHIHTNFNQTVTTTGRLSSSSPNLQNLPVDYDLNFSVRKAFVTSSYPEDNFIFVSADYSQIELRVLAHLSKDENLIQAFNDNIDIHSLTASRIFSTSISKIDKKLRRVGKTINFGIIYGMSIHGLATSLEINYYQAKNFIDTYFTHFKQVDNFLKQTIKNCKEKGYVETLYGRKRNIPEINHKNKNISAGAERMAINMPVQGTAADIFKLSMIECDKITKNFNSKMLLNVHDQLIFEVHKNDVNKFKSTVKNIMENIIKLNIPLTVDIKTGLTLGDF